MRVVVFQGVYFVSFFFFSKLYLVYLVNTCSNKFDNL